MASEPLVDLIPLQRLLLQLSNSIRSEDTDSSWQEVETLSKALADTLRIRNGEKDHHSLLGKTELPQSLTSLLSLALKNSTVPTERRVAVVLELLRVAANLCMDHEDNRNAVLETGFPQAVTALLESYAETIPQRFSCRPLPLTTPHLKIVRTAIGVLLNASLGYDPVKSRLNSLEAASTILKLSAAIYPPSAWVEDKRPSSNFIEDWDLRSGISNWSWRTIAALKEGTDDNGQILNADILPFITPSLLKFCPTEGSDVSAPADIDPDLFEALVQGDFDFLEETCTLIESLSLDVEDFRLELARRICYPNDTPITCLSPILDFIEYGAYPTTWRSPIFDDADKAAKAKAFDVCKAALIKSIVEVFGEDKNEEILWIEGDSDNPGGPWVKRMVDWISQYAYSATSQSNHRDDLAICGSLSLGNLTRKVKIATLLLSPPYSLASVLSSDCFLSPQTDIKLKHGILGLLKHLAQFAKPSPLISSSFSAIHLIPLLASSGVWDEKSDVMAEVVQLSAIGVVKHLCNASLDHTFETVIPMVDGRPTALAQILALIKRSDSISIKSEGSRVLVNVIKSLWFNERNIADVPDDRQKKREKCISAVLTPEAALTLVGLVGRSARYPILVNEGIVAISLLCMHKRGAELVLEHLTTLLVGPTEEALSPTSPSVTNSASTSSTSSRRDGLTPPRHALDMLIGVLRNVDNPVNFPQEVRVNACTFFLQLQRYNSSEALATVRDIVLPVIRKLAETVRDKAGEERLAKAANTVIEEWTKSKAPSS